MALAGSCPHYLQLPPSRADLARRELAEVVQNRLGLKEQVWVTRGVSLLLFSSMSTAKEDQKTPFTSPKES